ncbi:MAG: hypothetical protein A2Z99_01870 [Treponema sp. GWB1_62_6]|nr:MAG: hypothetical protein A2001_20250 [Treponema sp. GWC1_61_84]OHE71774.1 MAG: hypothetical protein A2Z99_01870 [Treponema sp. GWB1_62_6]
MDTDIELLVDAEATCGESPIWDPDAGLVYWADTATTAVHSWDPVGKIARTRKTDRTVRAIARAGMGRLVLICADGVYMLEPGSAAASLLCDPERGKAGMLPDDGTVDPFGRLVFNTFNADKLDDPAGSIYSIDIEGRLLTLDSGLKLPNGMAFSPDGKYLYVAEMFANRILRYDYDSVSGSASNRQVFAEVPPADGMPDGLIVDAGGFVWNAHWAGWRLTRYASDGRIDRIIKLPFAIATCPGFGGPDLKDLYITSAMMGLSPEELGRNRSPGGLFVIRGAGRGLEEGIFGRRRL